MQNPCRLIVLMLGLLLLQACHQPVRVKPIKPDQLIDLSVVGDYQFNGKMSFSDGQDGGSGSIQWQNSNGLINARLKAPLGAKSWRISEHQFGAELIADGVTEVADSAQTLISNQLGWQVPWQQLKSWVLGQPYEKLQAQVAWRPDGFTLYEGGWQIEYSRLKTYPNFSSQQIPHKMVARNNDYAIKLSIKQWTW